MQHFYKRNRYFFKIYTEKFTIAKYIGKKCTSWVLILDLKSKF